MPRSSLPGLGVSRVRRNVGRGAALLALLVSAGSLATACGSDDAAGEAESPTNPQPTKPGVEAGATDAGTTDATTPKGPFDPGPKPTTKLEPVFGELTIIQLDLPPGITVRIGESAIIVGPDGTTVLVDVGNSAHDDEVRAALKDLNTNALTPARGFPARGAMDVDYVLVTHFHGDHVGAFEQLLGGDEPLVIKKGVIHRGWVDVGSAVNENDFTFFCETLQGTMKAKDMGLCSAATPAPCSDFASNVPATNCDGLLKGDLAKPEDDGAKKPSFVDLGGGARLDLLAANGWVLAGDKVVAAPAFGHEDTNEENGRSLAGMISYGAFRYHFAGDMTGTGQSTEPDIESLLVTQSASVYGALGVDVAHANHHARRTSSNASFIAKLAPKDGKARNVVAGVNGAYLGSPYEEVLTGWADDDRLATGLFWLTGTSVGGASHPKMVNAEGQVIVATIQKGDGYWVQAAKDLRTEGFPAVRR